MYYDSEQYGSFINDEEKMKDFFSLSKEDFLQSYSYLTEEEYDLTKKEVAKIKQKEHDYLMSLSQDVLVALYMQAKQERDAAIEQLGELGYKFKK